jgi:DNA mismatch endonuclease (patch repair protein)
VARTRLDTDSATSRRLAGQRQHSTRPELAVRRVATDLGLRYRTKNRDLPGAPDLANRSRRWAIFVHGCYWHSHQGCHRATIPKRNRDFWEAKFAANRERDARAVSALEAQGYRVVVVWECELVTAGPVRKRLARLANQIAGKRPL